MNEWMHSCLKNNTNYWQREELNTVMRKLGPKSLSPEAVSWKDCLLAKVFCCFLLLPEITSHCCFFSNNRPTQFRPISLHQQKFAARPEIMGFLLKGRSALNHWNRPMWHFYWKLEVRSLKSRTKATKSKIKFTFFLKTSLVYLGTSPDTIGKISWPLKEPFWRLQLFH